MLATGPGVAHSGEIGWSWRRCRGSADAMLVQVEAGALLVLADADPGRCGPVCFRLTWPQTTPWVAVEVIERRRTRIGPYQLRLAPRRASDLAAIAAIVGPGPGSN